MSILLIIFVSMLLAWNYFEQPEWCRSFWEWISNVWNSPEKEKEVEEK